MDFRDLISASSIRFSSPALSRVIGELLYSSVALDFDMQAQTQSNWCWAATSTSVSHFYWTWSPWTQCKVANGELGRSDCCQGSVPSACNVSWFLDRALARTENFVSFSGPADFETVRAEIVAGRPVGARIGWSGGGGHFMVIYGCSRIGSTRYFNIDDPIYGKSEPTVETFSSSYQGSGSWTTTYFTKRAPVIRFRPYLIPERVFQNIWEARPLMHLADIAAAQRERPGLTLGLAHPVYNVGLDRLRERSLPDTPSHVRVFELRDEQPRAFFDVDLSEASQVRATSAENQYLDLFQRGVRELLQATQKLEAEAEVRLLQAPALYVDALWLHFDEQGKDLFVPLRSPFGPAPFRVYGEREFLEELGARAANRKTDDDLIAP